MNQTPDVAPLPWQNTYLCYVYMKTNDLFRSGGSQACQLVPSVSYISQSDQGITFEKFIIQELHNMVQYPDIVTLVNTK